MDFIPPRLSLAPTMVGASLALMLLTGVWACTDQAKPPAPAKPVVQKIEPHRVELLELAFDIAAAMPLNPHVKDRSRYEHEVVTAALELGQPKLAEKLAARITNYRKGVAFGEIAVYYADADQKVDADRAIEQAIKVAEVGNMQEWRIHAIRAQLSKAYFLMGDVEQANRYGANLDASQKGLAEQARAAAITDEQFDQQMLRIVALLKSEVLDTRQHGMRAAAALYERVYQNKERRDEVSQTVVDSFKTIPGLVRVDVLARFAKAALENKDTTEAIRWVDEVSKLVLDYQWPTRFAVPLRSRLAELRFEAGQKDLALEVAQGAWDLYAKQRSKVVDIWRSGTIRPLGAAYHKLGKSQKANEAYALAVEEGTVNPNARPTAEDLSATCVSMALSGFKPDEKLMSRIKQIRKDLGPPW